MKWNGMPPRNPARYNTVDSGVKCPTCGEGSLYPLFSCLESHFVCSNCDERFSLESLVFKLSDSDFDSLADLVGHRYCDRI